MCLILLSVNPTPQRRLLLAANRDEFYKRPTASAQFWENDPRVLAGRDLQAGGTWMGVSRNGRFAAITNIRDMEKMRADVRSRGELVADFLQGAQSAPAYLDRLVPKALEYNGFNLLLGDQSGIYCYHSEDRDWQQLASGVYGLSNGRLDSPWPKSEQGKAALRKFSGDSWDPLWTLMTDKTRADDARLPETGIGLDWERRLSSIFIESTEYGTRSTSILSLGADGEVRFAERGWDPGRVYGPNEFSFNIER